MSGVQGQRLDKGRKQKRQLTRRYQKVRGALPSGFERMRRVFEQLNISISLPSFSTAMKITGNSPIATARPLRIGVAPFERGGGPVASARRQYYLFIWGSRIRGG
jgi:hypothetical protein